MLSKVSGDTLGIAKSTDNVIVVCPAPVKAECYQDALTKIYDDIRSNNVRNAVVEMAIYFRKNAPGVTDEVCISTNSASCFSHNFANMISEAEVFLSGYFNPVEILSNFYNSG